MEDEVLDIQDLVRLKDFVCAVTDIEDLVLEDLVLDIEDLVEDLVLDARASSSTLRTRCLTQKRGPDTWRTRSSM